MIDKLFRHALEHAEATPPADLFDRVMEARAARPRRRALVWWRRPAFLALVLAGGAAATILLFQPWDVQNLTAEHTQNPSATSSAPRPAGPKGTDPSPVRPPGTTTAGLETPAPTTEILPTRPTLDAGPKSSGASSEARGPRKGSTIPAFSSRPQLTPGTSPPSATPPADGPMQRIGPAKEPHTLLAIRGVPESKMLAAAPRTNSSVSPYVLPKAEWWIGMRASALNEHLNWQGDQERLVNALNNAEPNSMNWALGLMGGRTWRSGFQVNAGLLYERSERDFSAIDQQVTVDQEVNTYYVTLNSEVFVSQVDTITTVSTTQRNVSASQERAVLRIPIEAGWAFDLWRLQLIPKAGLALDLYLQRNGTVLNIDGPDGRLVSDQPSDAVLRQRYPDVLLVTAGFDIAYVLNEHWSLNLGPQMMWTAAVLTRSADPPQGLPQRAGIGFGLTYLLPGKRP